MTKLEQRILKAVLDSLNANELSNAIAYLNWEPFQAGDRVLVGDVTFNLTWEAHVVFVDLEPGVNWGHECCYLIVRRDSKEVIRIAARMPPFLKNKLPGFRLLWRGHQAPLWAVATNSK